MNRVGSMNRDERAPIVQRCDSDRPDRDERGDNREGRQKEAPEGYEREAITAKALESVTEDSLGARWWGRKD